MKSYNHLWEKYLSEENYRLAVANATRHKGGKKKKNKRAKWFKAHAEELLPEMMEYAEHFQNDEHTPVTIYDGVRRKLMMRMSRKAERLRRKERKSVHDCRQMMSYLGWLDATDTYGFYKKRIKPKVSIQNMKRRISEYDRAEARRRKESVA